MSAILRLEDVHAGYGKAVVLNGVSMQVSAAERVIVLGPNGSGKSTIAKTLMGLTTFYEGEMVWDGRSLHSLPPWRRARFGLGYVPQTENVFRSLTVEENLLVGAGTVGRHESARRLIELYELFPMLQMRRHVNAGNLSGGERRLLAFATTLIESPKLLILDEPTSDLAPAAIDIVLDKIDEVCREKQLPLLMIEQNVERALEFADRVYVLIRGRVALERRAVDIDEAEIGAAFLDMPAAVGAVDGGAAVTSRERA